MEAVSVALSNVCCDLVEGVGDSTVLLDREAAEAVRWSIGLPSLVEAGANTVHVWPWRLGDNYAATRLVLVLGRQLHRCQEDMNILRKMRALTSLTIYSLFSEEETLMASSNEYGFEDFAGHCTVVLRAADITGVKVHVYHLLVCCADSFLCVSSLL